MDEFSESLRLTVQLLVSLEPELVEIVSLSLSVSVSATVLAALIGLPLGAAVAVLRFPGRSALTALLNASMGLPPVVVGLAVYLLLSRAGPLGELGLLFTPQAMVIAQCLLITPLIAALARQTLADLDENCREQLQVLDTRPLNMVGALLWDGRFSLITAVLAGFGRAIAEVGAVIIVGGNISGVTRVMTSTIALETSKGNLALALALGLILVTITLSINLLVTGVQNVATRRYA
ncbi:MAG: ABC transporter permease subunit [Wenzhouxiangella sp.]|nr:MAG: ABC transporter permease subunit [Wenzhouxiangella sp.]